MTYMPNILHDSTYHAATMPLLVSEGHSEHPFRALRLCPFVFGTESSADVSAHSGAGPGADRRRTHSSVASRGYDEHTGGVAMSARGYVVVQGTPPKVYLGTLQDDGEFVTDEPADVLAESTLDHPLVRLVLAAQEDDE